MTTERALWAALQAPGYGCGGSVRQDTCDCGQDLYQSTRAHCPRCGTPVGDPVGSVA